MQDKFPMTIDGQHKLRAELEVLKNSKRPQVISEIADAASHGDLTENAEYSSAKEHQVMIEKRIQIIEQQLSNAVVINPKELSGDVVRFGATVTLQFKKKGSTSTYKIVGIEESNATLGLLSYLSPLARTLIGKSIGDSVTVVTPSGDQVCSILSVQYI